MLTVDFSRLEMKPGFRVLDAGCGAGRHLGESFRRRGVHVVGVDRCTEDLVTARNTLRIMEQEGEGGGGAYVTMKADVTNLPFADHSFDLVICSEVLEHIPEDDRAIREIVRVLKPGESLAVSVPRFFPETVCWALSKAYRTDPGGHVRVYRQNVLIQKLEEAGVHCVGTGWAHALHLTLLVAQVCLWAEKRKGMARAAVSQDARVGHHEAAVAHPHTGPPPEPVDGQELRHLHEESWELTCP